MYGGLAGAIVGIGVEEGSTLYFAKENGASLLVSVLDTGRGD